MDEEAQSVRRVVTAVFRVVWDEYYEWEQSMCTDILTNLEPEQIDSNDHDEMFTTLLQTPRRENLQSITQNPSLFTYQYLVYEPGASTSSTIRRSEIAGAKTSSLLPLDRYEACAPPQRLILHGDDSNDMPFFPYADDHDFDVVEYTLEHKRFEWQSKAHNSDLKWICLETAHRLCRKHSLKLSEIDTTGILPHKLLPSADQKDYSLLQWMRLNDPPTWLPLKEAISHLSQDITCTEAQDCSKRTQDLLGLFCSNLNCVQGYCWSHDIETHRLDQDPRYTWPICSTVPEAPSEACGPDCYLYSHIKAAQEVEENLEYEDMHLVFLLFTLSPEASTCDIAALARLNCREVHRQRETWYSSVDRSINTSPNAPNLHLAQSSAGPESKIPSQMAHFRPCNHTGPCTPDMGCSCSENNGHCERTCCCPSNCHLLWKGCQCNKVKKATRSSSKICSWRSQCPCRLAGRECNPEVCSCVMQDNSELYSCQNSQVQRDQTKRLRVQHSDWGFGVFLCEDVLAHDLVCEYVGQLIYDATLLSRDHLAKHRNRFYAHELNTDFSVDASFVGNESRYINHAGGTEANCTVQIKLVNGDHRIGIYAKTNLVAGTELSIDYGPEADLDTSTTKSQ